MRDMNTKALASSEVRRSNGALLCLRRAGITRDNLFHLQESGQSIKKHPTIGSLWATVRLVSLLHGQRIRVAESILALYFSGEEDALSFTVRGGDRLQLEEVQQHLDLRHDFQGPAVPHADWLGGVCRDLAVLLGRPQQGRPENCRQVVERHLVDALLICHPLHVIQQE